MRCATNSARPRKALEIFQREAGRYGRRLKAFPVEAVDAADPRGDTLEFRIMGTSGAAAILMLIEMDHFMRHGRHQQIGGFDDLNRDADLVQLGLGFDAAAEMTEAIARAHHPENKIIRVRKIHPPERQSGAQIFIGILQTIGGDMQSPPDAGRGVSVCRALAHGQF